MAAPKSRARKPASETAPKKAAKKAARRPVKKGARGGAKKAAKKSVKKAPVKQAGARERRKKPESLRVRAILPSITVDDLSKSLDFYVGALGCVVQEEWRHEGALVGAMLKSGKTGIGLGQDDWKLGKRRRKGQGLRLYLETTQDIDALAERIRDAGVALTEEPGDQAWGAYTLSVDDPDGFHLTIFRAKKKLY